MNDKSYHKIVSFKYMGGGFIPANENARDLETRAKRNEELYFIEVTGRDLKFNRCYFALLGYIYEYLPEKFKRSIKKSDFYQFVKHLKGDYNVIFEFNDGTKMVEYESISFGRMSQKSFEAYISEQLPFLYSEVVGAFFEGAIYDNIISNIENDYKSFLNRLV
jgi:hypothetical protein